MNSLKTARKNNVDWEEEWCPWPLSNSGRETEEMQYFQGFHVALEVQMGIQKKRKSKKRGSILSMSNIQLTKFGVYRYRKIVPSDLRKAIGKREILKSLSTKDERMALLKAIPLDKHYDELFRKLRAEANKPLSELERFEKARELVASLGSFPPELRSEAVDWVLGDQYSGLSDWAHSVPRDENFRIKSAAIALIQGSKVQPKLTIKDALTL